MFGGWFFAIFGGKYAVILSWFLPCFIPDFCTWFFRRACLEIFSGGGCMIPAGGYIGRRVFHDGSGAGGGCCWSLPGVRACGCARVSRACLRKSGAGVCALVVGRSWFLKIARKFQQEKQAIKNGGYYAAVPDVILLWFYFDFFAVSRIIFTGR